MYTDQEELMLRSKIAKLEEEIKKLKESPIPKKKMGNVPTIDYNSDIGRYIPTGESHFDLVEMNEQDIKKFILARDNEIKEKEEELKETRERLFAIEWDKPENVEQRRQDEIANQKQMKVDEVEKSREEHENKFEDLNKLVHYLSLAGMEDLAEILAKMRYLPEFSPILKIPKNNDYLNEEIELRSREHAIRNNTQTTKREYNEIKSGVKRLSQYATKLAKKYKDLTKLAKVAPYIIQDIERKEIMLNEGNDLVNALREYFNNETSEYVTINGYETLENVGYKYLEFYRDSNFKSDLRSHKI